MVRLCIAELNEILGGQLSLGLMPPLAGVSEPLGRIVLDAREARPRDVYWSLRADTLGVVFRADEAFSRGALGVVVGRRIEPWAGKFCLTVPDTVAALRRLIRCLKPSHGAQPPRVFSDDEFTSRVIEALRGADAASLGKCLDALVEQQSLVA